MLKGKIVNSKEMDKDVKFEDLSGREQISITRELQDWMHDMQNKC